MKHAPFDDGTLETEKRVLIKIKNNTLIGFIDRLSFNKEKGVYEIHDYKTANTLPEREKFESDRQLALYSIAIKEQFGHDKDVHLIWHYLNHNQKIVSKRTNKDLEELKLQITNLIKFIEETEHFHPQKSILCDWCEYKQYCKAWGNELPEEYRKKEVQKDLGKIQTSFPTVGKYIKH